MTVDTPIDNESKETIPSTFKDGKDTEVSIPSSVALNGGEVSVGGQQRDFCSSSWAS